MIKYMFWLLLILTSIILFSQPTVPAYTPFPETEAIWTLEAIHIEGCDPNAQFTFYWSYIIQTGDTIIKGNTYHKLYREPYATGYPFSDTGYRGAIRQNINLKQVYIVFTGDSTEGLLYDFNNDTLNTPFPNTVIKPDDSTFLDVIDTAIDIDTNRREKSFGYIDLLQNYDCNHFSYAVIEGIGGGGLITKFGWFTTPGSGYQLTGYIQCFYIGDTVIVSPPGITDSFSPGYCATLLTVGITALPDGSHLRVNPNPVSNYIAITYNDLPAEHKYYFTVYNLLGQPILIQPLAPASTTLPCANWQTGIYIWQVKDETGNKLTEGKLVKE